MKNLLIKFSLIAILVLKAFSDNVVVFPTICIGFSEDAYVNLAEIIKSEIKNSTTDKIIEIDSVEKVQNKYNVSIQDIEYDKRLADIIGKELNADHLYFNTLIWNGEYFTIDFHRLDIGSETFWHRIYSFEETVTENEEFSKYGIKYIVNDSFVNKKFIKNIFFKICDIYDNKEYIDTIIWMRKNKIANLYLCFGAISGFDKNLHNIIGEYYYREKIELYQSILNEVLQEKELIEKSGEFVKVIHLGSYKRIIGYVYDDSSTEIAYPLVAEILKNPLNGVCFYGKKEESSVIESNLNREQRNRYWFKFYWE